MKIDPAEIPVDMFYSGATVHVEGTIPAGYDAAVLCSGRGGCSRTQEEGEGPGVSVDERR